MATCVNSLGDSGVHTLGETTAFVNPAGQLLLTWRGITRRNEIHDLMNIHERFMNIHELFMNGNHIWFMN